MLLHDVVVTSAAVGATRSRTEKAERLAALLAGCAPAELRVIVPWLAGELHQGRIGVGFATLSAAMARPAAPAPSLGVLEVDAALTALAALSGPGSNTARKDGLNALFERATLAEQRFLGPLVGGELRQGALDGVMADAVARAAGVGAAAVRRAAMLSGNLVAAALAALEGGEAALDGFRLEWFRPVSPMLAQTAADPAAALEALDGAARFEVKLDGARVQVHRRGDEVKIWSRALLPVGDLPEVVEVVRALPVREIVLDGEVLALLPDGRPRPFQVTMSRFGRSTDALRDALPLTPLFFDVLAIDGEVLLDAPLSERAAVLERVVPAANRPVARVTSSAPEAAAFFDEVVAAGHEGLMAKALDAPYAAGSRGAAWLKIKPVWTLDLVVLAAEWGSGRRRGKLSNLHLAARDGSRFVMLGKTFKGLTDELLDWQTRELLAREVDREGHVVHVRPELVVEIAFNEVQTSRRYPGGVALRFARVVRYRPDKAAEHADTLQRVRAIAAGAAVR